ncbi:MAG TPA: diacylglycerol kinase family protein [Candidatus Limnocylindrales bacterium]|nr:diacylglycerol kinase family protein [Candidatus Limnocylindrales bacterium]
MTERSKRSRVALIVNPVAGGGRGARVVGEAVYELRKRGVEPRIIVSVSPDEPPGDARRAANDGADLVIAVGGDGHAAAVASGLIGSHTPMAILPAGSANDLARTLKLPMEDIPRAVDAALNGATQRIDTIRVTTATGERHFLNVVGTGFDAEVAAAAERITVMRGAGRYVLAILRVLPRFKAATLNLRIDGEPRTERAMMIALANGPAYGGGMRVAPAARLDSGELEICIVGEVSKPEFLKAFPRVFRGTHVDHPAVTMLRGKRIEIEADHPLDLLGDGERAGQLPARVEVHPQSLSIVTMDL